MYRITVKTLQGNILFFTVDSYNLDEGFVVFTDKVNGKLKQFHSSNCEIDIV